MPAVVGAKRQNSRIWSLTAALLQKVFCPVMRQTLPSIVARMARSVSAVPACGSDSIGNR